MKVFNTATFKATANTPIGKLSVTFEYDRHAPEFKLNKRAQSAVAYDNDQKILRTYDVEIISVERV